MGKLLVFLISKCEYSRSVYFPSYKMLIQLSSFYLSGDGDIPYS